MKRNTVKQFTCTMMLAAGVSITLPSAVLPYSVMAAADTAENDTIIKDISATGNLTITKKDTGEGKAIPGAVYTAYKIMNVQPGENPGTYASYSVTEPYKTVLADVTPDELGNYSASAVEGLVKELVTAAGSDSGTASAPTAEDGVTALELDTGWYLITETTTPPGTVAGMPFLISIPSTNNITTPDGEAIVGTEWIYDISASPKSPVISVDKNIVNGKGAKDSDLVTNNGSFTGKSDTVAEGDYVNYEITTRVPEFADTFFHNGKSPTFEFKDTMSIGLTVQDNTTEYPVKVKIDGNDIPMAEEDGKTNYELTVTPDDDDANADLFIKFTDDFLKNQQYRGKTMTIGYYAQVNEKAVMGTDGNTNDVYMSYSDKPGTSVSVSPVEEKPDTYVYTYGIAVDKFAESTKTPLSGAKFRLFTDAELKSAVRDQDGNDVLTTDENGRLLFPRIDAGIYYLKEIESPVGYSLLANPVTVEIVPNIAADNKIIDGSFTLKVNGKDVGTAEEEHMSTLSVTEGIATVAVQNHKGFTLPSTGGSGIVMIISAAAAGIFAVSFFMLKPKKKED